MWAELVDFLACPSCSNPNLCISIKKEKDRWIDEGFIKCLQCGRNYPIYNGIPILLGRPKLSLKAINLFEPSTEQIEQSLEPTKKVAHLLHKTKVDIALDVGCGLGAYTSYFSANTLISFDISPYFVMKCAKKERNIFLLRTLKICLLKIIYLIWYLHQAF